MSTITDRQERIPGFRQKLLSDARIMVCGAGRTGNAVLLNLSLPCAGHVLIADMDTVAGTNLPGTVLFGRENVGEFKAQAAAKGFSRFHLGEHTVDYINGDLCYTLGEGVFRHQDVIINCVDNVESRLVLSRIAKLVGKPYIDTGISGFDTAHFVTDGKADTPCYACLMTEKQEADAMVRVRNSCDVTLKANIEQKKAHTIVTSAARVGAEAVETAIKILHYEAEKNPAYDPGYGELHTYNSLYRKDSRKERSVRPSCTNHISYDDYGGVKETPISAHWTLRQTLEWVKERYGNGYFLSLEKDCFKLPNRAFVTKAHCKCCGKPIDVYRPQYTLRDEDLRCEECAAQNRHPHQPSDATRVFHFSLEDTEPRVLDMTLLEIGIPLCHIVEMDTEAEDKLPLYLELTADLPEVMPQRMAWEMNKKEE